MGHASPPDHLRIYVDKNSTLYLVLPDRTCKWWPRWSLSPIIASRRWLCRELRVMRKPSKGGVKRLANWPGIVTDLRPNRLPDRVEQPTV